MSNRDYVEENEEIISNPFKDFFIKIFEKNGNFIYAIYDTDENNIIDNLIYVSTEEFDDKDLAIESAENYIEESISNFLY